MEGAGEGAKTAADEAPGQLNKLLGSLRVRSFPSGLFSAGMPWPRRRAGVSLAC